MQKLFVKGAGNRNADKEKQRICSRAKRENRCFLCLFWIGYAVYIKPVGTDVALYLGIV